MNVGDKIRVTISKVTLGKDDKIYVTLRHLDAENNPTLIFTKENFNRLKGLTK